MNCPDCDTQLLQLYTHQNKKTTTIPKVRYCPKCQEIMKIEVTYTRLIRLDELTTKTGRPPNKEVKKQ